MRDGDAAVICVPPGTGDEEMRRPADPRAARAIMLADDRGRSDEDLRLFRLRMWLGVFAVSGAVWFAVGMAGRALVN